MISTSVTDRTSVTAGLAMGSRKIGSDMFAAVFAKTSVERRRFCLRSMCRMAAMRPRELGHREAYARSSASCKRNWGRKVELCIFSCLQSEAGEKG